MSAIVQNVPEINEHDLSLKTATDLSAHQYHFVKIASGIISLAATGEKAIGILQNAPVGTATVAAVAHIRVMGLSKLKYEDTIAASDYLKPNTTSSGKAIKAGTNKDQYGAVAVDDGVTGDLGVVIVEHGQVNV